MKLNIRKGFDYTPTGLAKNMGQSFGVIGSINTSSNNQAKGQKRIEEKLLTLATRFRGLELGVSLCSHGAAYHYDANGKVKIRLDSLCHDWRVRNFDPEQDGLSDEEKGLYRNVVETLRSLYKACKQEGVDISRMIQNSAKTWERSNPILFSFVVANRLNRKVLLTFLNKPFPYADPMDKKLAPGEEYEAPTPKGHGEARDEKEYKTKVKTIDGVKRKERVLVYTPSSMTGIPNAHPIVAKKEENILKSDRDMVKNLDNGIYISKKAGKPTCTPQELSFPEQVPATFGAVRGAWKQQQAYNAREVLQSDKYETSMYGAKSEVPATITPNIPLPVKLK